MADIVFDANAVGQVVTYVAPGYLAYLGYRLRYPGSTRSGAELIILSVVGSLPLVAFVSAVLPGAQQPTQLGYIALLLAVAFVVGYLVALARGGQRAKNWLRKLGYDIQPEGTIYAQTLRLMSDEGSVLVELKD